MKPGIDGLTGTQHGYDINPEKGNKADLLQGEIT